MAKVLSDKQRLRNFFRDAAAGFEKTTPACRHFGECGGCEFQNIPYPAQLDMKRRAFSFIATTAAEDLRKKEGAAEDAETRRSFGGKAALVETRVKSLAPDIVPSPLPLGYRQRMDYVFAFDMAGLRRANRFRHVVELEECPLLGNAAFSVLKKAVKLARDAGITSYDYVQHVGELRYFVVRRSRRGDLLLSLVVKNREAAEKVRPILERLAGDGDIKSGHCLLAEGMGDVSFGEPLYYVDEPYIVETMNGIDLAIGPNTFFQSNPAVAESAYAMIREFVPDGATVFDMYAGVGSIGLNAAATAGKIIAAENVRDNVELAAINIRQNGLAEKVTMIEADAAAWLAETAASGGGEKPDMVVVNPPRPGVDGRGMAAIKALGPARVAYLSCNPFSLIRDLAEILDGYALTSLTLFDMFPQTRHFETLALLERRDGIESR